MVTEATSASRPAGQGASASARSTWASMIDPPCFASSAARPGPWNTPFIDVTVKPPSTSSSVSSGALSSRVWNGLTGVSRPGENVILFGVDISSTPPGRSTRAHSATNCGWSHRCSMTWKLTTTSTDAAGRGSAARLPWRTSTRG